MGLFFRSNKKGGIVPTGTKQITISSAGTSTHDVAGFADAEVTTSGLVVPTGTKQISINSAGTTTHNVSGYENAEVTTSDLVVPSGNITVPGTANAQDVSDKATVTVSHTDYYPSSSTYTSISAGSSTTITLGDRHNYKYVRVKAGSSSGYLSETTLWTNGSPSSSMSPTTKSLDSGSFSSYSYIKFVFRGGTSSTGQSIEPQVIVPRSFWENTADSSGHPYVCASCRVGSAWVIRCLWYYSSTAFSVGKGFNLTNNATDNGACMPYKVIGINVYP